MPMYDFENLLRAWAKSVFGLFVGFTVFYAFNSVFLGVLAAAFFFFIPVSNPASERIVNSSLFGGVMLIILFWAFGHQAQQVNLAAMVAVWAPSARGGRSKTTVRPSATVTAVADSYVDQGNITSVGGGSDNFIVVRIFMQQQ